MAKIRPLPPVLVEAAKKELNEDPGRIEKDIQHLRDWLAKQPHLRARTDDQFLVSFLRSSKYSLERAKEKLDGYYTLRTALPEFFSNRDPSSPKMKKLLKIGLFLPLGEDSHGRRVILVRVAQHDPKEVTLEEVFKHNMMLLDILSVDDDVFVVKGAVCIIDHLGMGMGHIGQYHPSLIKKGFTVFQEGYPFRYKGLQYVHMPSVFETVFNLCKSVMNDKLRKMVSVHSDFESLHKEIPKAILPKELGGDAGTCEELTDYWSKKLLAWKDYFAEEDKYGVDENKRLGKPRTHQDLFGLEGSFRSLNVD